MIEDRHIFISVGSTFTDQQEEFVCAVEARLRADGLIPHTVGRDTFSSDAPLKTITELMRRCSGAVVIALERSFYPTGIDKRGGAKETLLSDVRVATPWNQIEAAMAYSSGLPLLVMVERSIRNEGFLERGYDWYVQQIDLSVASLSTPEFNGVLAGWKLKLRDPVFQATDGAAARTRDVTKMSVVDLVGSLNTAQLWSLLTALAGLVAGAFALGAHFSKH